MRSVRYDEHAGWYDSYVEGPARPISIAARELLGILLGEGTGRCLDLACGGGHHVGILEALGWRVIGTDISSAQLRRGQARGELVVLSDAARLPFPAGRFDVLVSVLATTDFDDLPGVLDECRRVLRPDGHLVIVGAHPCFGGAFVESADEDGIIVHPGYRRHGRVDASPYLGDGIRHRVGAVNVPLPVLLNCVIEAGFMIRRVEEDTGPRPIPALLGVRAQPAIRP